MHYEAALEHFVSCETIRSFQNSTSYIIIFPDYLLGVRVL